MSGSFRGALVGVVALGSVATGATIHAQQPPQIGIAPVTLSESAYTFDTAEQHRIRVVVVARGLAHPFSVAMLPNGDALVTERGGRLRLVRGATGPAPALVPQAVAGVPEQPAFRTGGLQDVALHPRFAANRLVYFTFNKAGEPITGGQPNQRQSALAIFRGRFEGASLSGVEEIFSASWQNGASGSRMAFGPGERLFITTGAPFDDQAQRLDTVYGKVLRLTDDGKVPPDNPFAGKPGARPEIYSLGHRDQLGLTVHAATGQVFNAEHGPNGGDEVNLIQPGRNYGWPTVTFGRDYQGASLAPSPVAPGPAVDPVDWSNRPHVLYRRSFSRVAGQPVRRKRAPRRGAADGRSRASGDERQVRGTAPRNPPDAAAPAHPRCPSRAGRSSVRDHR